MKNAPTQKPTTVKPSKKGKTGGPTSKDRKELGFGLSRVKNQKGG